MCAHSADVVWKKFECDQKDLYLAFKIMRIKFTFYEEKKKYEKSRNLGIKDNLP